MTCCMLSLHLHDIFCFKNTSLGDYMYCTECKKFWPYANAPVHIDPGPRSCGRCCREEPRLAARTGGRIRRRRKGPNYIHWEPLVLAAVFWIYSIAMLSLAPEVGPWKNIKAGLPWFLAEPPPLVLIPWPARVGQLQWPSGRFHQPDKRERHRQDEVALVFWSLIKLLKQK